MASSIPAPFMLEILLNSGLILKGSNGQVRRLDPVRSEDGAHVGPVLGTVNNGLRQ